MIKAAVFDFGNVLSLHNDGTVFDEMSEMCGIPRDVLATAMVYRGEFDRGTISSTQLYQQILERAGYEKESRNTELCSELGKMDLHSWARINTDSCAWALDLQKQGFKLGILSNMPHEFLSECGGMVPPFAAADVAVFSCNVNLIKPEPAIYQHLIGQLGLQPEEIVFFDDIEENVEAAKACGINAIKWNNLKQAQADFVSLVQKLQ